MHWDGALRGVLSVGFRRASARDGEHLPSCSRPSVTSPPPPVATRASTRGSPWRPAPMGSPAASTTRRCTSRCGARSSAASAPGTALSLVLVDLDDFKQVNERHGHLIGDEVLRRVGQALRTAAAPLRHGGPLRRGRVRDRRGRVRRGRRPRSWPGASIERRREPRSSELPRGRRSGRHRGRRASGRPGMSATDLIDRADRALMYGKHERGAGRGRARPPTLPGDRPARALSRAETPAGCPAAADAAAGPAAGPTLGRRADQSACGGAPASSRSPTCSAPGWPAMTDSAVILGRRGRRAAPRSRLLPAARSSGCATTASSRRSARRGDAVRLGCGERTGPSRTSAGLIGRCLRERRPVIADDVPAEITGYASAPETAMPLAS